MADIKKLIKDWFTFKEPEKFEKFILKEKESETRDHREDNDSDEKKVESEKGQSEGNSENIKRNESTGSK
ncbi:MAG TPA: spore germination protein, partial [Acetivibrio clariflavus]|nr:spore germination protein [Acetivibrio clariflavus]